MARFAILHIEELASPIGLQSTGWRNHSMPRFRLREGSRCSWFIHLRFLGSGFCGDPSTPGSVGGPVQLGWIFHACGGTSSRGRERL